MVHRVLVADDSATFRALLCRVFDADPSLKVVGEARDGREAIELAKRLKPDVITMDVHMPITDGFEAIRRIMETVPRPIVVVSGALDPRDVKAAFRAIEAGALAVVGKPVAPNHPGFDSAVREILDTVKLMSGVKVVRRRGTRTPSAPNLPRGPRRPVELVAIGASTGGPAALETILRDLPADLPAPVVVVQHITGGFEQGLVDWLQGVTPLYVRLAAARLPLRPGEVVISETSRHLLVSRDGSRLGKNDLVDGHCPSASVLFSSVASSWGEKALGVILTGMGRDGTSGLRELKQAGGTVIAQDAATSVVHGMPAAAEKAGVVDHVLPLEGIAAAIKRLCRHDGIVTS